MTNGSLPSGVGPRSFKQVLVPAGLAAATTLAGPACNGGNEPCDLGKDNGRNLGEECDEGANNGQTPDTTGNPAPPPAGFVHRTTTCAIPPVGCSSKRTCRTIVMLLSADWTPP